MIKNFEKIRQLSNLSFLISKKIEDEELILLENEIILFEKTQYRVIESLAIFFNYNYKYITITNLRIVIWFNRKGLLDDKIFYQNFWYVDNKQIKPSNLLSTLIFLRDRTIYDINCKENKFIKIRILKHIPWYIKIYHQDISLIYEKIKYFNKSI